MPSGDSFHLDVVEAEALVLEALRTSGEDLSYYFIATGIAYLAEIEGHRGRSLEAARLLGVAEALRRRVGAEPRREPRARDPRRPGSSAHLKDRGGRLTGD